MFKLHNTTAVSASRPGTSAGFTLVEVLLAMAILSVGLLGTNQMMVTALQANKFSRMMSLATISARNKTEELRGVLYPDLANGTDAKDADGLTRTWTVTSDGTPMAGTKTISVTVTWTDDTGQNRQVNFQSIVSQ